MENSKKVVLITGGSGLLGSSLARYLSDQKFHPVILDLTKQEATKNIDFISCDIVDRNSVKKAFIEVQSKYKIISGIVHCAAINPKVNSDENKLVSFFEDTFETFNFEIDVSIKGCLNVLQEFIPLMQNAHSKSEGSIVLVGSDLSVIAPDQRIYIDKKGNQTFFKPVSYSIIKHAMLGLTKYLSTYFASQGIRVNCISPGPILENQPDYLIQNLINRIPMGKLAHTKDIVGAIQFLLDDTSSYITGQNIVVDGGRTTW